MLFYCIFVLVFVHFQVLRQWKIHPKFSEIPKLEYWFSELFIVLKKYIITENDKSTKCINSLKHVYIYIPYLFFWLVRFDSFEWIHTWNLNCFVFAYIRCTFGVGVFVGEQGRWSLISNITPPIWTSVN